MEKSSLVLDILLSLFWIPSKPAISFSKGNDQYLIQHQDKTAALIYIMALLFNKS